ncbi:MAG: hypothetical protein P1V36_04850 [Planctomycetota bacterium]|nr:hypothetical protein [Planctomycetota bacterium]
MRNLTYAFGLVFILLGIGLYVGSGMESVTALIPAFLGVLFVICAAVASTETRRKHAMHVSVLLALLGFGGSVTGLIGAVKHIGGTEPERVLATWGRAALALLCVVYIVLAVRSFVAARRARTS